MLMDSNGYLRVRICLCSSLWILMGPNGFLWAGASISPTLWGGPTYNNQNFFGEILRILFALFVRRNSTFDAVFFSVLSRLRNECTVLWLKKEKTKTRGG